MQKQWELDERTLTARQAQEFSKLLERAGFFALPPAVGKPGQTRDGFCYQLTVEEEGKTYTVKCAEPSVPGPLRGCIEWILKAVRSRA